MDSTQLLKGVLHVTVLAVVEREDGYGYDIVRRLRDSGLSDVGEASVYGTLRRLFRGGALTTYVLPSEEGPPRRYYGITAAGREALEDARATWRVFCEAIDGLLLPNETKVSYERDPYDGTRRKPLPPAAHSRARRRAR